MAKLVFGMNQSLDGYVDHTAFRPSPRLFRHFIDEAQSQAGCMYGRQMYEVMRYWDDHDPGWGDEEVAFAAAWRNQPKWVVSRSLTSVGPHTTLVDDDDLEAAIRRLTAERDGEVEVAGPRLAGSLTELGLIDEYRIYLHPVVLGHGTPYFTGPRPPLRLVANDQLDTDVIRLTYVPAETVLGATAPTRGSEPHADVLRTRRETTHRCLPSCRSRVNPSFSKVDRSPWYRKPAGTASAGSG
jgi:dihydrofolate reductase